MALFWRVVMPCLALFLVLSPCVTEPVVAEDEWRQTDTWSSIWGSSIWDLWVRGHYVHVSASSENWYTLNGMTIYANNEGRPWCGERYRPWVPSYREREYGDGSCFVKPFPNAHGDAL